MFSNVRHALYPPLSLSLPSPFPLHMSPNIQPLESHSFQDEHGVRSALYNMRHALSPSLSLPLSSASPFLSTHVFEHPAS